MKPLDGHERSVVRHSPEPRLQIIADQDHARRDAAAFVGDEGALTEHANGLRQHIAIPRGIQKYGGISILGQALQQVELCDRFGRDDAPVSRRDDRANGRHHPALVAAKGASRAFQAVVHAHPLQIERAIRAGLNRERRQKFRRCCASTEGGIREEITNALLESVAAHRLDKPKSVGAGLHMDSRCTMAAKRYATVSARSSGGDRTRSPSFHRLGLP